MIKIENTDVYGFEAAIRGMRNPLNSWDKSDSHYGCAQGACLKCGFKPDWCGNTQSFHVGEDNFKLMKQLVKAGSDHSKFMRMITVTCDITAPMYWWAEMDTYKVGTVRNSCSKMHKLLAKPFEASDFSAEYANNFICGVVDLLNSWRDYYLETKDKKYWYAVLQLLPESYNQRSTWQANYAVLRNIYHARKSHKLNEWNDFCTWIKSDLPYSELITEDEND